MELSEPSSSSALTEFHDAMKDPIESHLSDHSSPEADEPDPHLSNHPSSETDKSDLCLSDHPSPEADKSDSHLSDHSSSETDKSDFSLSDCSMQLLSSSIIKIYRTLEALIDAVNKHVSRQSYAVVKAGQKKNKNGDIVKNLLKCSHEGKYKNYVNSDLRQ